jgi:hypothetical protein
LFAIEVLRLATTFFSGSYLANSRVPLSTINMPAEVTSG